MIRYLLISALLCFFCSASPAQSVYKTPGGKKYHLASCHMVTNVSEKLSVEEAIALGLQPCKICKPAAGNSDSEASKAKGESQTVQCKGMTRAGTRCRHMTSIANGYCYQHQPG